MEAVGVLQEILRIATHEPSGRPRFISSAIRRSLVVAYMGLRAYPFSRLAPVAAILGSIAIALALSRGILEAHGISQDQIGRMPWMFLQTLYAIGFIAATNPLFRRLI